MIYLKILITAFFIFSFGCLMELFYRDVLKTGKKTASALAELSCYVLFFMSSVVAVFYEWSFIGTKEISAAAVYYSGIVLGTFIHDLRRPRSWAAYFHHFIFIVMFGYLITFNYYSFFHPAAGLVEITTLFYYASVICRGRKIYHTVFMIDLYIRSLSISFFPILFLVFIKTTPPPYELDSLIILSMAFIGNVMTSFIYLKKGIQETATRP